MKYNRVLEYLQRKETGGFGWVPKYEDETKGDSSAAYMTGWYAGMFNEVIDAIGPERLRRLLYVLQEIDEGKGKAPVQPQGTLSKISEMATDLGDIVSEPCNEPSQVRRLAERLYAASRTRHEIAAHVGFYSGCQQEWCENDRAALDAVKEK